MTVKQAAEVSTEVCHHFAIQLDDEHTIDLVPLEDHMSVLERWIRQAQASDRDAQTWHRRYRGVCRALWAAAGVILILIVVVARG